MWYFELLAVILSIASLIVSFFAWRISKRATRLEIEQQLGQRSVEINEALVNHEVKGPYAHHLQIPDDQVNEFTKKAVLLLHHVNFLRAVFDNRDILDEHVVSNYSNWAKKIVQPWIEADDDLQKTWEIVVGEREAYQGKFMDWLQGLIKLEPYSLERTSNEEGEPFNPPTKDVS